MNTLEIKAQCLRIYDEKGLRSVKAFLNKMKVYFWFETYEFGLDTNRRAQSRKNKFLSEKLPSNTMRFHYYNKGITSNGWMYNMLRGCEILILPTAQEYRIYTKDVGNVRLVLEAMDDVLECDVYAITTPKPYARIVTKKPINLRNILKDFEIMDIEKRPAKA